MIKKVKFAPRRSALKLLSLAATSLIGIPLISRAEGEDLTGSSDGGERISFGGNAITTGWLNFDMPDGRHIVLDAKLNGVSAQIVLDSGVGSVVLSRSMAAKLGLQEVGAFTGVGVTGRAQGALAKGIAVSIGNLTIQTAQTTIFDLSVIGAATGRPIVAIIGQDLLRSVIADIDFPHTRLSFYSPTAMQTYEGSTELSLTRTGSSLREVPVSIEGRPPIEAVFDLGSDTPLYVSQSYISREGLLLGKSTSTSLSAGVEGTEINTVAVLDSIKIGNTTVRKVPIEVPQKWNQPAPAFIGLPILSRFRLIVDFGRDRLRIIPNLGAVSEPFRKDRSGIGAVPSNDHLVIIHIAEHSPAEAAGLRVGDEIIAINGRKIDAEYLRSRPREGSKPAGTNFQLTLKNGSKVALVLADYF